MNLRKSSSENFPFLLIRTECGKIAHYKTNSVCSKQKPCLDFPDSSPFALKHPIQNCHFLFQRISELEYLMMRCRSNLQLENILEAKIVSDVTINLLINHHHNNHQFIKNKGEEIIFIHKSINNYKMELYDKS